VRTSRPRLHVVGAGAAGAALARALARSGWSVGDVVCRTAERAERRAALVGAGSPRSLDDVLAAPPGDDGPCLLLVAVPDRAIAAVAARLAEVRWPAGSVALHLSGCEEIASLAPLREAGVAVGGLHPLRSFVDAERDADTMTGTTFALEGDDRALAVAEDIARTLDGRPFRLQPGRRGAWHAGAAHACNHLVALVDQALDLMEDAGLDRDEARAALVPLLAGTVDNLARHPPGRALTGPIVRGDGAAVERHVAALEGLPADVRAAYEALASRALALAEEERDLAPELAARMRRALERRS